MLARQVGIAMFCGCAAFGLAQTEPSSQKPASNAADPVVRAVTVDSSSVQSRYPDARLFQVTAFGVVPRDFSADGTIGRNVQASYDVGLKDRYVQATQRSAGHEAATPELVEVPSKLSGCAKPYPSPGSEVCAQQMAVVAEPPEVTVNDVRKLNELADWVSKAGWDASEPYDLTLTSANQLTALLAAKPSAGAQACAALGRLQPDGIVVALTQRSTDRTKIGSTMVIDVKMGGVVCTYRLSPPRLPPGGRR
jgi:hypothetical protein